MTVQVTFEVDEASKAKLEASAARRGETLSAYIAQGMAYFMEMELPDEEFTAERGGNLYDPAKRIDTREAWIAAIEVGLGSARTEALIPHEQVVAEIAERRERHRRSRA